MTASGVAPAVAPALAGVRHYYQVSAVDAAGHPAAPVKPYTVTVTYGDWDLEVGGAVEDTLALYRWDGVSWVWEPTSRLDAAANTVTATPGRFSTWGVLGEARVEPVYLPLVIRSGQ